MSLFVAFQILSACCVRAMKNPNRICPRAATYIGFAIVLAMAAGCATTVSVGEVHVQKLASRPSKAHVLDYMRRTPDEERYRLVISIADQRMVLLDGEKVVGEYAISTALKGASEELNSDGTPRGLHVIAEKIGEGQPVGMIFKGREPTGVISELNPTDGIPPVVTRLFRLRGLEASNQTTYDRLIYLHGSPHEALLGRPASGGCIRMSSADVVALFNIVDVGTPITISERRLPQAIATALDAQRRFVRLRDAAHQAVASSTDAQSINRICYGHAYGTQGVPQNYPAAKRWCQIGADAGNAHATTILARLYETGRLHDADAIKVMALYKRAADLGDSYAIRKTNSGIGRTFRRREQYISTPDSD